MSDQIVRGSLRIAALVLLTAGVAYGFTPAFEPDAIDSEHCRQWRDGVASNVAPETVRHVLGFHDARANGEAVRWVGGKAAEGGETRFDYLVTLMQPVAVGALCVDVADEKFAGSRNNGAVWYARPDAPVPPDPAKPEQWLPVVFGPSEPVTRFAVLPPGTQTRAFLYRDVRVAGVSRVDHWRFFRQRLANITPVAQAVASGGFAGGDPMAIVAGKGWETRVGARGGAISAKDPAWFVLSWPEPRRVDGLFLRSNATALEVEYLPAAVDAGATALAEDAGWRPWPPTREAVTRHDYRYWACSYRWLTLPATDVRAVRVRIGQLEKESASLWFNGLAAFSDLQQAEAPKLSAQEDRSPFRFRYTVPVDGQVALVLEDATGRRIKNIVAQVERPAGPAEEPWDLKDAAGNRVPPGTYRLRGIAGPAPQLLYGMTPYPNVDQLWPDRTPWLQGHSGAHGWLSDHSQNWAVATVGDRVYFGAPMAEAGVCLIECDLDGRKQWGKHDFGAWLGVGQMAGDDRALYVASSDDVLYRLEPATREVKRLAPVRINPERRGHFSCMAAAAGKIYLGFTGEEFLDNAFNEGQVDLAACLPRPASDDFLRALRVKGQPPGQIENPNAADPKGNGRIDLESTAGDGPTQYLVIAFKEPVPIGSVVFPHPGGKDEVRLSVLSARAPYPPQPAREQDWVAFAAPPRPGVWNCLPAPPDTRTRALRISFTRPGITRPGLAEPDDVSDLLEGALKTPDELEAGKRRAATGKLERNQWYARIEGLRVLRRRFSNAVAAGGNVRVNGGEITAAGEWDAQRREALGAENPGIYVMEWPDSRKLTGLAVKEIDGAVTEVDVWQGEATGALPLEGPALDSKSRQTGWRHVATYRQRRRSAYYPSDDMNKYARYMDGMVDFNEEITTRGVRLRVVQQWMDHGEKGAECRKHDGRSEHGMHYTQSYAAQLDTRLCRVLGVAPLQYEGGEPAVDKLVYQRIEVRDGQTGALEREIPAAIGWHGLSCGPDGKIYAINRPHTDIVRIDPASGDVATVVADCNPNTMTVGPDGSIYVNGWSDGVPPPLRVFAPDGRLLRTVGKGGGRQAGPWDPERFNSVHRMTVDRQGSLWVLENQNYPRRIVQYDGKGALVKEIFGNTMYGGGGGGNINRYDATRMWYGGVEFGLDWQKHRSFVRGLMATDLGGDLVALRVKERPETYLTTAPLSLNDRQSHGVVYIYDNAKGTVRMVAAMGSAEFFEPLRRSQIVSMLAGAVPREFVFAWSDRNANETVEPDEVQFAPRPKRFEGVGRFDYSLGCTGPGIHYRVKAFLPNGVPVYEPRAIPGAPHLRLTDGSFFTLGGTPADMEGSYNFVTAPDGALRWSYPAGAGMSGLYIPSWEPGRVDNQFAIIGHEVAPQGELGEFVVIHANTGEWNLWTADGLPAAQVLLHKNNGVSRFIGPAVAQPGMRLDPMSANQEHFHGFFTRTEPDNRYFIVAGFSHMSVIEVKGLERFRRFQSELQVTAADLKSVQVWEGARAQRQLTSRALVINARSVDVPPRIDGDPAPHEWPSSEAIDADGTVVFAMAYDKESLYLRWTARGLGPFANDGSDYQRLFKTGAAVDLQLGTDAKAASTRAQPAAGDLRLLIASVNGKPEVVLYQPVMPAAAASEGWATRTAAAGETRFDRVVRLTDARVAVRGDRDFTVEAAIPLHTLGLSIRPGLRLRGDWGVLTSSDGHQVKQRMYWANKTATGTSDEAVEARLEPAMWGTIIFGEADLAID